MTWKRVIPRSTQDLAKFLLDVQFEMRTGGGAGYVWRGEPQVYPGGIRPRIDRPGKRHLRKRTPAGRLAEEIDWYDHWWNRMRHLVLPRDLGYALREDGLPDTGWLNYAAHYGCKTRLVDWTTSPWVASYFACSDYLRLPARIWGFRVDEFFDAVNRRWDEWGVPRVHGTDTRDATAGAFTLSSAEWITLLYSNRPNQRMASQQGLFTMASQLGRGHESLIDDIVPRGKKYEVIISAGTKLPMLHLLAEMGTHHENLHFPMVDQIGGAIEWPPKRFDPIAEKAVRDRYAPPLPTHRQRRS